MTTRERVLALVEPRGGGDTTLQIARDAAERGGTVKVVMLITQRVRSDIRRFAESEELDRGVAEAIALQRLEQYCADRVGGDATVETEYGEPGDALRAHLAADTTLIALADGFASERWARRLASTTGIPVVIAPPRAA